MKRAFTALTIYFIIIYNVNSFPLLSPFIEKKDQVLMRLQDHSIESDSIMIANLLKEGRSLLRKPEEAYPILLRALALSKEVNNKKLTADAQYRMAWHYFVVQDLELSNLYCDSSLVLYQQIDNQRGVAKCHNFKAVVLSYFGSSDATIEQYKKAKSIYASIPDTAGMMTVSNNLGAHFNVYGLYQKGKEEHTSTLIFYRKIQDTESISRSLYNLGVSNWGLKEYDQALVHLEESYRIRKTQSNLIGMAESLNMLAEVANELNVEGDLKARTTIGSLGFSTPIEMLDTALAICQRYDANDMIIEIYAKQIKLLAQKENFEQAYLKQIKYHDLLDSIKLTEENLSTYVSLQTQLENERQQNQILRLENEKTIEQINKRRRLRERNILGLLVLVIGGLGYLLLHSYRQRLIARKLEVDLGTQQIKELKQQQEITAINSILEGEEKERNRISKDLHDGVGNLLSTIKLQIAKLQRSITNGNGNGNGKYIESTINLIDDAHKEIREISHNMMPISLQKLGLFDALEDLCRKQNLAGETRFYYQQLGDSSRINQNVEIMLYRICQELVQNINKHALASEVIVQLTRSAEELNLTIEDDGIGFESNTGSNGFGLKSIASRVSYMNGKLSIDTKPGEGTTAQIVIPI